MEKNINSTIELKEVISQVTMNKNCVFHGMDIQFKYRYVNIQSKLDPNDITDTGWMVKVEFWRKDTNTDTWGWGSGREEFIRIGTTESGVVKTLWVLVEMIIKHELMESFLYQGKRPFNPHNTIEALNSLQ